MRQPTADQAADPKPRPLAAGPLLRGDYDAAVGAIVEFDPDAVREDSA
jgi:hypothetical protein